MKIRSKNGRIHTAFSAFDTLPGPLGSTTLLSLFAETINPLDKYCPDLLRRRIGAVQAVIVIPANRNGHAVSWTGERCLTAFSFVKAATDFPVSAASTSATM